MSSVSCGQGHQNPDGANFCLVCGEPLHRVGTSSTNVPPTLRPGKLLRERYVVRDELGEGGFGRTYLIEDTGRFNERLVLKEFAPSVKGTSALQKAVELFQREAVTLYQLQHPQIPKFWEIFQAESRLFLVEDFIEGQTYESLLNGRIRIGEGVSEAEVLKLFRDLLPVLSYIHRQGVIHRDIAPDNIILSSRSGLPILIDMGAAKQAVINVTTVHSASVPRATTIGKTGYAPDEQVRLGIVAPYSDLHALAVTAIVLMTAKQPHQLLDQYTMKWNWEQQVKVNPVFAQVINRMLASRPDQRFQSADEVLQALAPLLNVPIATPINVPVTTPGYATPSPTPYFVTPTPTPISPVLVNNSGSGEIFDDSVPIPAEIKGWNWGAFLMGFFWSINNKVWIGLLTVVPYVGFIMVIILGVKGNEWAWKSRRWASIEQFKANQRGWTIAGLVISAIVFAIVILASLSES